jgi:3-oxoacyl-[acyl-carrier-protein] synthase II
MEKALKDANVSKSDVNYINAHATSTPVGDLCELNAVRSVFPGLTHQIKMNATKSMTGHCLGAAGGIESIALIKAIETGMIHPTINLEDVEEIAGDLDLVPGVAKPHRIKVAINNSFGFGGHNCSLIFGPYGTSPEFATASLPR